jgi:hypothetical protein
MTDKGDENRVGFAMGHGIIVVPGPGIDGYSVCVIAGEVFTSKLPGGFRAEEPAAPAPTNPGIATRWRL